MSEVFKATIRAGNETDDVKIVNLLNFTLKDIMSDWCNNYPKDYLDCIFVNLQLVFFVKNAKKFKMMNKFTYN